MRTIRDNSGFSLIELSIVLGILALLLGGLLPTIAGQIDQARRTENRKQMDEIRNALLGFAISKGRLPCPDTDTPPDGIENVQGAATTNNTPLSGQSTLSYSCSNSGGGLPYNQLGISALDTYGSSFTYKVTPAFASKDEVYSAINGSGTLLNTTYFTLSSNGNLRVCNTAACSSPRLTDTAAAIVASKGPNWSTTQSADEQANTDNNNDFVSRDPSADFDDVVVWISPNTLFSRMIAAGKLP